VLTHEPNTIVAEVDSQIFGFQQTSIQISGNNARIDLIEQASNDQLATAAIDAFMRVTDYSPTHVVVVNR
jgi:hypothetical protein